MPLSFGRMQFQRVAIETIDYVLPDSVLSSEALEKELASVYERLGLPFGRLELMTGIRERRLWASAVSYTHLTLPPKRIV